MYGDIAIVVESEMQGTQRTGVIERCEIDLIGEVRDAPVALLGGVPAMARVATKRNKQQIPLVKSGLQVWWDLLIKRSAERKKSRDDTVQVGNSKPLFRVGNESR